MSKKCAVVGAGISGLMAAHLLQNQYDVTVFEANNYPGGHAHTHEIDNGEQTIHVDTGFMVFNEKTYPNFLRLLDELGVEKQRTEMSFSYCNVTSGFEYNGHQLSTLFSDKKNLVNRHFYKMLKDIWWFNRHTQDLDFSTLDDSTTIMEFIGELRLGEYFSRYYFLPMVASIWSSDIDIIEKTPAKFILTFFQNHGLLQVTRRPQWYTVAKGSRSYVERLQHQAKYTLKLNEPVRQISRHTKHIQITTTQTQTNFDFVVIATHSDQALMILSNPNDQEVATLSRLPYQKNTLILHQDTNAMPKHTRSWASWNYIDDDSGACSLTYYLNRLQNLPGTNNYFATINPNTSIREDKIIGEYRYAHPCFEIESIAAQQQFDQINGLDRIYYAGAYWYNGFHEDGVRSALAVAEKCGVSW